MGAEQPPTGVAAVAAVLARNPSGLPAVPASAQNHFQMHFVSIYSAIVAVSIMHRIQGFDPWPVEGGGGHIDDSYL